MAMNKATMMTINFCMILGLWNFVTADNVNGCISRDEVLQEVSVDGYTFGGDGYVIIGRGRYNPTKASLVKLSFRTFATEGLMFLMGTPGKDFLSIEIKDGKVVCQFELGSGRATLTSTQRYNDGNWHVVTANRMHQDLILKVDSRTVASGRSPGNLKDLDIDNYLYFGGFKGTHTYSNAGVTQKAFEGCIKDIQLGSTNRNIQEHIEAKDVMPGCQEIVPVVSSTPDSTSGAA